MNSVDKLAYGVLALAHKEKARIDKCDVLIPGQQPERLGDILIEVGQDFLELLYSQKPDSECPDFIDNVRAASAKLSEDLVAKKAEKSLILSAADCARLDKAKSK